MSHESNKRLDIECGQWIWTTRDGSETDLVEEISARARGSEPRAFSSGWVTSRPLGEYAPIFARQGFPILWRCEHGSEVSPSTIGEALLSLAPGNTRFALHVWTADTDEGNRLSKRADALYQNLKAALEPSQRLFGDLGSRYPPHGWLVQVAMIDHDIIMAGATSFGEAHSLWRGGRARMRVGGDRPSRSAHKIEEALAFFGTEPGQGDVCVDLGAAPGGWTWALAKRGARVIAVDPARLRPDVKQMRNVQHVPRSAFQYEPKEPVDWLFCDMAWRPLEAASLLAKWSRKKWARFLVANLKLPMKQKAEMVLRLEEVLTKGGWRSLRIRQLYHDRDEVTVVGVR